MTNNPLKILIVAGARPNFIKVAPLIKAAQAYNRTAANGSAKLDWRLIHTGQHYDTKMSNVFFQDLDIPAPNVNLDVGSSSHATQTANIMNRFEPICHSEKPDWVIVVGDVNSTMACAIVAAKLAIRVAHVEAGLRSYDRTMPEEINRVVTDALADLLFTPSGDANENLLREGIPEKKIRLVGNIMIDALIKNLGKSRQCNMPKTLGLHGTKFLYVTLHRPSNVDDPQTLAKIMSELNRVSSQLPVVFPLHPRTKARLVKSAIPVFASNRFRLLEPIGYHESLCLTEQARLVITDSGGLQEEATYFRTPCLTLRPNTERPITIRLGSNRLTDLEHLHSDIDSALLGNRKIGRIPELWDGKSADRIISTLLACS